MDTLYKVKQVVVVVMLVAGIVVWLGLLIAGLQSCSAIDDVKSYEEPVRQLDQE